MRLEEWWGWILWGMVSILGFTLTAVEALEDFGPEGLRHLLGLPARSGPQNPMGLPGSSGVRLAVGEYDMILSLEDPPVTMSTLPVHLPLL